MHADERAVRETHATWMAAVNAGDVERLLDLMTDDVRLLGPGQAPFGRDHFRTVFCGAHRAYVVSCTSELQEVVVAGGLAHTVARDALAITPRAGGATAWLAGHRLTLYRRQPDGTWRLAREAHTLVPVPQHPGVSADDARPATRPDTPAT